jgi:hypothetical protein
LSIIVPPLRWAVNEQRTPLRYLSRENAIEYKEVFALLAAHRHVGACRAKLIGGTAEKSTYGVLINLRDTDELLTDIRDTLAPGTPLSDRVPPF